MERTWFPSELPVAAPYGVHVFPHPRPALLVATGHAAYAAFLHPTPVLTTRVDPEKKSPAVWHENRPNVVGEARYSYGAGWLPGLPFGSVRAATHTDDEIEAVEMALLKVDRDVQAIFCIAANFHIRIPRGRMAGWAEKNRIFLPPPFICQLRNGSANSK